MTKRCRPSHRALQPPFDAERLADRTEARRFREAPTDEDRAFITRLDAFFLATTDAGGGPRCSCTGGDPGFVRGRDARTIAFPVRDGTGMHRSLGNARERPAVGLRFVDFGNEKRRRPNGSAAPGAADRVVPPRPEAPFVVRVAVGQAVPDGRRTIRTRPRGESSRDVPRPGVPAPVAGWTRKGRACDVPPAGDRARDPERP